MSRLTREQIEMLRRTIPEGKYSDLFTGVCDLALTALSAEPVAESKLADAGVFCGHHGLRGLAEADKFWEAQPYGTRLYYGEGITEYLQRGVLQAAVEILDRPTAPPSMLAENARLREALEYIARGPLQGTVPFEQYARSVARAALREPK